METVRPDAADQHNVLTLDNELAHLKSVDFGRPQKRVRDNLSDLFDRRVREMNPSVGGIKLQLPHLAFLIAVTSIALVLIPLSTHRLRSMRKGKKGGEQAIALNTFSTARDWRTSSPEVGKRHLRNSVAGRLHTFGPSRRFRRMMIVQLSYSDPNVSTETNTTVRVQISQSELAFLGFPVSETRMDRQVLAQVTLGDDGLPRSIRVPLPIQFIKEER